MSKTIVERKTKLKGLNSTTIKVIAILAMLIDHIAWGIVPTYSVIGQVMHIIGRITAPIMCFFIAEGYYYTRNIKKYVLRLAIFALISHVPFIYFETGTINILGNTGVIYTLCISLIAVIAYDKIKNNLLKYLVITILCIIAFLGDWMCIAVIMTLNFWIHREEFKKQALGHCVITLVFIGINACLLSSIGYPISHNFFQGGILLALPIIYLYNGEKGEFSEKHKGFSKWFFYIFYPAHLVILRLLNYFI